MDENSGAIEPNEEPSPDGDSDDRQGWVTLREAEAITGIPVRTIRAWYGSGKIESQLIDGPHGRQRIVQPDQVAERAAARRAPAAHATTHAERTRIPSSDLIPVEVLAKLEAAWERVVQAEARAAVAERQIEFEIERRHDLERRLAELEAADTTQAEPLPHISEAATTEIRNELEELRSARQEENEPEHLPDIPDSTVARLSAEVEELRRSQESRPWWSRLLFGKSR